jgi:hypothetical protein
LVFVKFYATQWKLFVKAFVAFCVFKNYF